MFFASGSVQLEVGCAVTSFLLFFLYHFHLYAYASDKRSSSAFLHLNERIRKEWTTQQQCAGMLPINTLRDFERAAASRANMALLFMTAVFGFAGAFSECVGLLLDSDELEAETCSASQQYAPEI